MRPIVPTVFHHNRSEFDERYNIASDISESLHIDFMDGAFVPGVSLEPEHLPAMTGTDLTAHLMVKRPAEYLHGLKRAGFTRVAAHIEALSDRADRVSFIESAKASGFEVVLAKHAETPLGSLTHAIDLLDGVLLMGIHAGSEGQPFHDSVLDEIAMLRLHDPDLRIEVDGGVDEDVARALGAAGATIANSGSYISGSGDPAAALERLEAAFHAGRQQDKQRLGRLRRSANTIRQHIIRMLRESGSGHSGGPLGMADIFSALYLDVLQHRPDEPAWTGRDLLFLSNGHICPVQYAAMAEAGYFPEEELLTLRTLGSRLQGHPHNLSLPGIENSGGPLGQGISQAVGAAIALRMDGRDNQVYCVCGDGEIEEGQCWEAFLLAGKMELSNLTVIIDRNNIQIDGPADDVMPLEPIAEKFDAFRFTVLDIDGNDMQKVLRALHAARTVQGPTVIIARTTPGKGVSFMEQRYEWHGRAPNDDEATHALDELQERRRGLEERG